MKWLPVALGVVLAAGATLVVVRALKPVDHAAEGYAALRAHHNQDAIEHLRLASSAAPDDASLHYDLGIAYENAGWIPEGLAEFEKAVALQPTERTYRAGLAQTKKTLAYRAQNEGRHADAVKMYQGVLLLTGDDPVAWYNLGVSLKKIGRADEASKAQNRASQLDPEHYKPE